MNAEKNELVEAMYSFIRQRAGLGFGNYENVSAYRQEQRQITKDRHHAEALLAFVARSESIDADKIKAGLSAYAGRLSWDDKGLSYCAGQFFPTEYRKAVCACLSQTLWHWFREDCECDTREKIHKAARRQFGRSIVSKWFN